MLNLYLIYRTDHIGYDEYDSAVVAAENEVDANLMHPCDNLTWDSDCKTWIRFYKDKRIIDGETASGWSNPKNVKVEYIGKADSIVPGVILASYNAG